MPMSMMNNVSRLESEMKRTLFYEIAGYRNITVKIPKMKNDVLWMQLQSENYERATQRMNIRFSYTRWRT